MYWRFPSEVAVVAFVWQSWSCSASHAANGVPQKLDSPHVAFAYAVQKSLICG